MKSLISLIMSYPFVYSNVTQILRGKKTTQLFVDTYVRPKSGDRILDIGCGPGDILNYLPPVEYYGFDQDPHYVASAKKRFGNKGKFFCRQVSRDAFHDREKFNLILAMGIVHHLTDDDAVQLFELAHHLLKPDGRLITYDGCYTQNQTFLQKFTLDIDRGKYIRDQSTYELLASKIFNNVITTVRQDLLSIPYNIIIIECKK